MFLSRMFVTVNLTSVFKVIPEGYVAQRFTGELTARHFFNQTITDLEFRHLILHFAIQRNKQTKMNEFNLINFKNCLLSRYNHIAVSRTLCARKPYSMILGSRSILLSWSYVQSFINSYNNRLTFDSSYISIVR